MRLRGLFFSWLTISHIYEMLFVSKGHKIVCIANEDDNIIMFKVLVDKVEREGAETISAGIQFLCDTGTKEL